jgi:glycosyltransferase involved in cell wall biosynthesis
MVTGEVADIWHAIAQVDVFVFPMTLGAGLQNKILEAMCGGRPILTTSIARRGFGPDGYPPLIVADDDSELQVQLGRCIDRPAESTRIGVDAERYVRANFSWDAIGERFEAILLRAMHSRQGALDQLER